MLRDAEFGRRFFLRALLKEEPLNDAALTRRQRAHGSRERGLAFEARHGAFGCGVFDELPKGFIASIVDDGLALPDSARAAEQRVQVAVDARLDEARERHALRGIVVAHGFRHGHRRGWRRGVADSLRDAAVARSGR